MARKEDIWNTFNDEDTLKQFFYSTAVQKLDMGLTRLQSGVGRTVLISAGSQGESISLFLVPRGSPHILVHGPFFSSPKLAKLHFSVPSALTSPL